MEGDINALRALWRVVLDPVDPVLAMLQDSQGDSAAFPVV